MVLSHLGLISACVSGGTQPAAQLLSPEAWTRDHYQAHTHSHAGHVNTHSHACAIRTCSHACLWVFDAAAHVHQQVHATCARLYITPTLHHRGASRCGIQCNDAQTDVYVVSGRCYAHYALFSDASDMADGIRQICCWLCCWVWPFWLMPSRIAMT